MSGHKRLHFLIDATPNEVNSFWSPIGDICFLNEFSYSNDVAILTNANQRTEMKDERRVEGILTILC